MTDTVEHSYLISAVIAVYNVERYLPALFESLERQSFDMSQVQLIFVDDGSTDGSLELLNGYRDHRGEHVVVLTQQNQWVAAARNAGLEMATGEWVTFTDPDDVLAGSYLEEVAKFIRIHGHRSTLNLLAAHQMRLLPSGELADTHPHRLKFERGSRISDLRVEPIFQLSVNSAFFRRNLVEAYGIRFDGRVRPHFEDGHYIARYLLLTNSHELGLMASAKYHYRTREDDSSLLGSSYLDRGKYTSILRYGYLDLLRSAASAGGVPRWLENTVLYELFWYFKEQLSIHSLSASAPADALPEFHELMRETLRIISHDAIRGFDFMHVDWVIRLAFQFGYDEKYVPSYVRFADVDEVVQLVRFDYWFNGDLPSEQIIVDGAAVKPVYEKIHDFTFYGKLLMRRRIIWLPRGRRTIIRLNGDAKSINRGESAPGIEGLAEKTISSMVMNKRRSISSRFDPADERFNRYAHRSIRKWWHARRWTRPKAHDWALATSLRLPWTRRRFAHAWALMDKNDLANDNAEHLYRHLAKEHPDTNPWFILEKNSDSWRRLKKEGFKLVEYGSWRWKQLLLSADHLASSHADYYVTHPMNRRRYGNPRYKFTFLQHGVTQDDLSRWLNTKPFDLMISVTKPEHESFVGTGPYKFTAREVALTGFPRHDELLRKREQAQSADLIVIIPTWRQYLVGERVNNANERLKVANFLDSEYAKRYSDLLNDPTLAEIAAAQGVRVVFMPHPHMRPYLSDFAVPKGVEVLDFASDDIQSVIARAAMVITDYSSIAFEAAFVGVPVAYYQFDRAEFWGGKNPRRRGYFDYNHDGFGEVAYERDDLVDIVARSARNSFTVESRYADLAREAFGFRDQGSSERVYRAMRALRSRTE
ncbi:CDP-glycerol glycerophosphotransferase family protein [Curtobacterium sp. NPDC098951]|uniref:bifunctional glycosyltransferase/CDP-glycerol:glycerophosphate glycerophosphotransferase n=1 Tax=Curtobacterium sp. NPDC098951 TaxID=3363974 RepID=UPI00382E8A9C